MPDTTPPTLTLPYHLVNAFTTDQSGHSGNQAAIVQLPSSDIITDERKALIARDFNFAETAYLVPLSLDEQAGSGDWGLRWWTPEVEVILCGHATLASALVLFQQHPSLKRINFHTRWSGILYVSRLDVESADISIELSLPSFPASVHSSIDTTKYKADLDLVSGILSAGDTLSPKDILRVYRFPDGDGAFPGVIVELDPEVGLVDLAVKPDSLRAISPGFTILTHVKPKESVDKVRIDSRVFVPAMGVDEDPVTGSAHAYLTSYYTSPSIFPLLPESATRGKQPHELQIEAHQVSKRGGVLWCYLSEDKSRVRMSGKGSIWAEGILRL